jgi:hypothetical protein
VSAEVVPWIAVAIALAGFLFVIGHLIAGFRTRPFPGVVWTHPDGRVEKVKFKDWAEWEAKQ